MVCGSMHLVSGVRSTSGAWINLVCGAMYLVSGIRSTSGVWCADQCIWCLVCGELGRKDSFSQLQNFSSSIEEKSSKGTQKHFKLIRFCIKNVVRIQTNHTNWWWPSNISPSLCQSGGNPLKEEQTTNTKLRIEASSAGGEDWASLRLRWPFQACCSTTTDLSQSTDPSQHSCSQNPLWTCPSSFPEIKMAEEEVDIDLADPEVSSLYKLSIRCAQKNKV